MGMASPKATKQTENKMKIKPNKNKCIWTACIAAIAVCMTLSTASAAGHPANLGSAYISNVTSNGNCVASTTNGGGIQFWDIQAGGTYTVTLSGVTDCASQGNENTIGVIVRNSTGGNIPVTANQATDQNNQPIQGVYTFTVTLTNQCLTMPIEYCATGTPLQEGTGKFAQDNVGGVAGGHSGHLRTATFDGSCVVTGQDNTCQGTGCQPASITVCKYFHFDPAVLSVGSPEQSLSGWPFCLTSITDSALSPVPQSTGSGGCATFGGLTPGEYVVSEADANDTNWFHSSDTSEIVVVKCGQTATVKFGNYCTSPSGGLTLGFWSNKNGNKILTGNINGTGTGLLPAVVTLLNTLNLRNANGTDHSFVGANGYADFRNWLLGATATNMAYMLSAQLTALELDVTYKGVDGLAFDLCSSMTLNELMNAANTSLGLYGSTPSGNAQRPIQEMYKTCIDAINNNGPVVPVTPCDRTNTTYTSACPQ
jgi:hypothetical protein